MGPRPSVAEKARLSRDGETCTAVASAPTVHGLPRSRSISSTAVRTSASSRVLRRVPASRETWRATSPSTPQIPASRFLDLNEHVGGYDHDGKFRAERSEADMPAVEAVYCTGRLTNGGGGLASTPIIDYRAYTDDLPNGDIHVRYHTNSMRERLREANGSVVNHVSLLEDNRYGGLSTNSPLLRHAVTQMDAWLSRLDVGDDERPTLREIGRARPDALVEGCMTRDEDPSFIAEVLDREPESECEQRYPSASFPREVAGESVQADVIKCQTREPRREDYGAEFTDGEWERLTTIFAGGVCDYSVPGHGQQPLDGVWQRIG